MTPLPKHLWKNVRAMTAAIGTACPEDRSKLEDMLRQVRARYSLTASQERVLRADARGCLFVTRSRSSGVEATVWPADDTTAGKYDVICEAHHTTVAVDSMDMARHAAAHPTSFCDDCRSGAEDS